MYYCGWHCCRQVQTYFFLTSRVREQMSILSLNINGATSKLESKVCCELFHKYDIVCLSELKCSYPLSLAGFKCIRNRVIPGEELRGGVAVFFKNFLWEEVHSVSSVRDQVWFKIHSTPGIYYGAVYITPRDSPYFSLDSFALLQEHCCQQDQKCVVIGDLNARMPDLSLFESPLLQLKYRTNPDTKSNANGVDVMNLCISNHLKPLNQAIQNCKVYDGGLTYKQKDKWISQLDWALVSESTLPHVSQYHILKGYKLPTNHAPVAIHLDGFECCLNDLLQRSKLLGVCVQDTNKEDSRRPVSISCIDLDLFKATLPEPENLWELNNDLPCLCRAVSDTLYETATRARKPHSQRVKTSGVISGNRWSNILESTDAKQLWRAINWKGSFDSPYDNEDIPSDKEFCEHFDRLLNPHGNNKQPVYIPREHRYIPVLDDPIQPGEVLDAIDNLKSNKAAGIDGVPPGVLKLMTDEWLLLLTYVFNEVFCGGYPEQWSIAKVFTIFKKGQKHDPGNYRGISIVVALAKLYDSVLSKRFSLWYKPRGEQAGSQKGRGCEEQILAIKLLIDIARKTKQTLYVTFVDYEKAYDRVDRYKLAQYLDEKGCGTRFLQAIQASLQQSSGKIGSELFTTTAGVRQGGSTSCPLFTFFIDPTIKAVGDDGPDKWLGDLHALLLMDDTAIFATSRERMTHKLSLLKECTDYIGMSIHPTKSQYLTVNCSDMEPFHIDSVTISHTSKYTYLGTPILNAPVAEHIKEHLASKSSHVIKFLSFLVKNKDAPYAVKMKVWESAFKAAIFYGCETWLTKDMRAAERPYMMTLKQLLDVRPTTCNDVVLIETGVGSAKSRIVQKQVNFVKKLMSRIDFENSYLHKVMTMARNCKSPMGKRLQTLIEDESEVNHVEASCEASKAAVRNSDSSRRQTYLTMNPTLTVSDVYSDLTIPEYACVAFSHIRLSSHRLRIETARWSRTPREDHLCMCGDVQTEEHVLLYCPLGENIRVMYGDTIRAETVTELLNLTVNWIDVCKFFAQIFMKYM